MTINIAIRGADVGYSKGTTDGFLKGVDEGLVTSAYLYLDTVASEYALKELAKRPWISVEWQAQLKGSPILGKDEIPSLIDEDGTYVWSRKRNENKNKINYDDAVKELKAQLDLCYRYLGRYPETAEFDLDGKVLNNALIDVCEQYHIPYNTCVCPFFGLSEKFANSNYYYVGIMPHLALDKEEIKTLDSAVIADKYDTAKAIMEQKFEEGKDYCISIHPAFIDDALWKQSHSYTLPRVKDVIGITAPSLREYFVKKGYRLVNQRDILENTNQYQEHLKEIGSNLYVG